MADPDNLNSQDQKVSTRLPGRNIKKPLAIVGILVAVILVAGLAFAVKKYTSKSKPSPVADKEPVPVLAPQKRTAQPVTEDEKTIAAADKLIAAKNYSNVIKLLEPYEPKVTEASKQYAIRLRLGNAYAAINNPKEAINWYERAQQTAQPGADSLYLYIAQQAEKSGDKPKAIAAYHKVIELLKAHPTPTSSTSIDQYQTKIKALGGV